MQKNGKPIIGVPVYNDLEPLKHMISSLILSTNWFDKILIVNSKGNDETERYLKWLETEFLYKEKIEIIRTKKEGPLKAYNILFENAKQFKKDLLLTQTDVLFPQLYKRDWLEWFQKISENEQIGAVIPINGGGVSGPDYLNGLNWLGGWCTYLPYRVMEKGIKFDESFPNGYGVDVDLTMQIIKSNLKIIKVNYWVDHHMMNNREHDNDSKTEKMKQESAKYFRKKWNIGEFK